MIMAKKPAKKAAKKPAKKSAAKKPAKKAAAKKFAKKAMAKKPAKKMMAAKAKKPFRGGGGGFRRLAGDIGPVPPLKYRCSQGDYEVTLRMIPERILKCPHHGIDLLRID